VASKKYVEAPNAKIQSTKRERVESRMLRRDSGAIWKSESADDD